MSVNRILTAYRLWFGANEAAQILTKTVVLTDAQVKALPSTPISLIATPGANKRIELLQADLWLLRTAAAYTNVDPDGWLVLQLGGVDYSSYIANGGSPALEDLTNFFNTAGDGHGHASLVTWSKTDQGGGAIAYGESVGNSLVNAALTIMVNNASAGNFTAGNAANTLTVRVTYRIHDVP